MFFLISQPASYCEKYPVTEYTLEVVDLMTPGPPYIYTLQHNNTSGSVHNLTGDTIYVIKVLARNAVGNVSTKGFNLCKFRNLRQSKAIAIVKCSNV